MVPQQHSMRRRRWQRAPGRRPVALPESAPRSWGLLPGRHRCRHRSASGRPPRPRALARTALRCRPPPPHRGGGSHPGASVPVHSLPVEPPTRPVERRLRRTYPGSRRGSGTRRIGLWRVWFFGLVTIYVPVAYGGPDRPSVAQIDVSQGSRSAPAPAVIGAASPGRGPPGALDGCVGRSRRVLGGWRPVDLGGAHPAGLRDLERSCSPSVWCEEQEGSDGDGTRDPNSRGQTRAPGLACAAGLLLACWWALRPTFP